MSRRRRHMETSEVALMAVMTKAMGAFLILMVFGMQYFVPDMTAEQISKIIQESLHRAKTDLQRIEKNLGNTGVGAGAGSGQAQTEAQAAARAQEQADITEVLKRLDEAAADIERLRVRLDQAIAQLRHSEDERSRLSAENDALKAELAKARALIESLSAQVAALTTERDKLAAQLQSLAQARNDMAQAANALKRGDVTKAELDAVRRQVEAAQASLDKAEAQIADLSAKLAAAQDTIKQLKDENAALKKALDEAQAALSSLKSVAASVESLRAQLSTAEDKLKGAEDENSALAQKNRALADEVAQLRKRSDYLAKQDVIADTVEFKLFYTKECGDTRLGLVITRLAPTDKGPSNVIPSKDQPQWTPVVRGIDDALGRFYKFGFTFYTLDDIDPRSDLWRLKNVENGERFAVYIFPDNVLDKDTQKCLVYIGYSSSDPYVSNYVSYNIDSSKYDYYGPSLFIYDIKDGLVRKSQSKEEFDYMGAFLSNSPCMALSCNVHGKAYRKELHELLVSRHGDDLVATKGIDPEEKGLATKMLDDLIDLFAEKQIGQRELERWVALVKTVAPLPKDKPLAPGEHVLSRSNIGVMAQRLTEQYAPKSVRARFVARALMGWWTKEDAEHRLAVAKIPSISDDLGPALETAHVPQGANGFAMLEHPMLESGAMTLVSAIDWAKLMTTKVDPAPSDPNPDAVARTADEMRKKGLDAPFIAAVESALRAKTVRLEDVDRTVAATQAVPP